MSNPDLTIGIPVYNGAAVLPTAVGQLLNQSLKLNIEILILNDGSTDDTQDVALNLEKEHPEVRLVTLDVNQGVGHARNCIVEHARGEYLAWFDCDDDCSLDRFALQWPVLKNEEATRKNPFFVTSNYSKNGVFDDFSAHVNGNFLMKMAAYIIPTFLVLLVGKTQYYRDIGPFDEKLERGEDADWLMRFAKAGGEFVHTGGGSIMNYNFSRNRAGGQKGEIMMHTLMDRYPEAYDQIDNKNLFLAKRYKTLSKRYVVNKDPQGAMASSLMAAISSPSTHTHQFTKDMIKHGPHNGVMRTLKESIADNARAVTKKLKRQKIKIRALRQQLKQHEAVITMQAVEIKTNKSQLRETKISLNEFRNDHNRLRHEIELLKRQHSNKSLLQKIRALFK